MKELIYRAYRILLGILVGFWLMAIWWKSSVIVRYTYDSRPYIQTRGRAYMLISDQPMKIKSVNVVESEGK